MYIRTDRLQSYAALGHGRTSQSLQEAIQRLSSGNRINGAADDAAGLAVSVRLRARGVERNKESEVKRLETADAGLDSIQQVLHRMKEIAVQSKNGTYSAADLNGLTQEWDRLKEEVERISGGTTYNQKVLLKKGAIVFDGRNDYAEAAGNYKSIFEGSHSFDITFTPEAILDPDRLSFVFGLQGYHAGIFLDAGGVIRGQSWFQPTTGGTPASASIQSAPHAWQPGVEVKVAYRIDAASRKRTLLVNGVMVAEASFPAGRNLQTLSTNNRLHLAAGNYPNQPFDYMFHGSVAEANLYAGSTLAGRWDTEGGRSVTGLVDQSGNGRHMSLNNGAMKHPGSRDALYDASLFGLSMEGVDVSDPDVLQKIEKATEIVSRYRTNAGGRKNQLEYETAYAKQTTFEMGRARMRMEEADLAAEASQRAKHLIKQETSVQIMSLNRSYRKEAFALLLQ